KSKLPEYVAVRDIAIQPKTNDLVLATHGRGIFIIDDISPFRSLSPELLQRDAALLPTRPAAVTTGHYSQAFPATDAYVGPNSTENAVIQYYLKDRLSTGEVTVEILDAAGKKLVSFPGTKRKGINFVQWDMRTVPPKAARGVLVQGEAGVYAGFIGQLALPGKYQVRLTAGAYTETGTLELVPDPLQPGLDYAQRRMISSELFGMVEDLGYLVAQVQALKDSAALRAGAARNASLKNKLNAYAAQLEDFRKTLTETIESKGITGEQQLRARLGKLYVFTEISDELPTQSVMDRLQVVRTEIQQARAKADGLFGKDLAGLNLGLQKEKLAPLTLLDRAGFEKQYEAGAAPAGGKGELWRQIRAALD
ncbi:MAG: hypothetical protein JNK89_06560, partial [Saprospiraceae bacterium]|nr:hypothetical protein [Saprospiraceae bacterium]